MENYLNYQCSSESWEQQVSYALGVNLQSSVEIPGPAVKQRCQANARERDRTQKLVSYL